MIDIQTSFSDIVMVAAIVQENVSKWDDRDRGKENTDRRR